MVALVQCPRGQEHNPLYAHLPFFIGDRLVPAHMRSQLPPARNPTPQEPIEQRMRPGDVVVLTFPGVLSEGQRKSIAEQWAKAAGDQNVIVLEAGATARVLGDTERLDRIEAKLDALLDALADEEEEQPGQTLDGGYAGSERDTSQPL